jgi:DNA adenine methylase
MKPRTYSELYNDLDREVVNVFRVLQSRVKAKHLEALLRVTPFSREEFDLSYTPAATDVERARRTIIRSFMGFGSDSISRLKMSTGFRYNANRSGTTAATDWRNYPNYISTFIDRLQGVTIENRNALEILPKVDRPDALHYVDPPYPMSTRRNGNGSAPEHRYRWEMNDEDHRQLADCLKSLAGMVIISSYQSEYYDELFRGWRKMSWTAGNLCSANTNAQTRTEVVWMNAQACKHSPQRLFEHAEMFA